MSEQDNDGGSFHAVEIKWRKDMTITSQLKDVYEISPLCGFYSDASTTAEIRECMNKQMEEILKAEGLKGFEQPKSSAAAHETGHALVHAVLGQKVTRVEIYEHKKLARATGLAAWGGHNHLPRDAGWIIVPNSPTEQVLYRICIMIAGLVGEHVLDPENVRRASSLDELATAQLVAAQLHGRDRYPGQPEQLWGACWQWASLIVKGNEAVGHELMNKLILMGSIRGKPLAAILARVRTLPPGYIHKLIERELKSE